MKRQTVHQSFFRFNTHSRFALLCWAWVFSVALVGCGRYGKPGTSVSWDSHFGNGSGSGYNGGLGNQYNPNQGSTGSYVNQDPRSAELKECDYLRGVSEQITGACGDTFQNYSEELSRNCAQVFQGLYNWDCNGMRNRITQALSYCSTDIRQFYNYLPASCKQVLSQYSK